MLSRFYKNECKFTLSHAKLKVLILFVLNMSMLTMTELSTHLPRLINIVCECPLHTYYTNHSSIKVRGHLKTMLTRWDTLSFLLTVPFVRQSLEEFVHSFFQMKSVFTLYYMMTDNQFRTHFCSFQTTLVS